MFDKQTLSLIKKTAAVVGVILVVAGALFCLWKLQSIVIMVVLAYILMLALQGPVRKLQKWFHLPRAGATVIAYILFLVIMVGAVALLAPVVVKQLYELVLKLNIPTISEEITEINLTLNEITGLVNSFGGSISTIVSVVSNVFGGFLNIFMLMVISYHMSMDHENFYKKIFWITNNPRRIKKVKDFILVLEKQLGGWIRGEALLMLVIGVISYIGFLIIGIPYALPLAILAGVLELIPNIGPVISAVPAAALALISLGPIPAIITIAFCIIVQQLENIFLVPKIMKTTAEVNPLISIVAILSGFVLLGVAGALLAIPFYITVRATYSFWIKPRL